jgi:hypothetical protein
LFPLQKQKALVRFFKKDFRLNSTSKHTLFIFSLAARAKLPVKKDTKVCSENQKCIGPVFF